MRLPSDALDTRENGTDKREGKAHEPEAESRYTANDHKGNESDRQGKLLVFDVGGDG